MLDRAYRWLNDAIAGREWAAGDTGSVSPTARPRLSFLRGLDARDRP